MEMSKQPRLSVRVPQVDLDSLSEAEREWPWKDRSEIIRVALRLGLEHLKSDPSPLGPPPVKFKGPEATVSRSAAADNLTGNTKDLLGGLTAEEEAERKRRAAARKAKKKG